jgi:hypothetical protein
MYIYIFQANELAHFSIFIYLQTTRCEKHEIVFLPEKPFTLDRQLSIIVYSLHTAWQLTVSLACYLAMQRFPVSSSGSVLLYAVGEKIKGARLYSCGVKLAEINFEEPVNSTAQKPLLLDFLGQPFHCSLGIYDTAVEIDHESASVSLLMEECAAPKTTLPYFCPVSAMRGKEKLEKTLVYMLNTVGYARVPPPEQLA